MNSRRHDGRLERSLRQDPGVETRMPPGLRADVLRSVGSAEPGRRRRTSASVTVALTACVLVAGVGLWLGGRGAGTGGADTGDRAVLPMPALRSDALPIPRLSSPLRTEAERLMRDVRLIADQIRLPASKLAKAVRSL